MTRNYVRLYKPRDDRWLYYDFDEQVFYRDRRSYTEEEFSTLASLFRYLPIILCAAMLVIDVIAFDLFLHFRMFFRIGGSLSDALFACGIGLAAVALVGYLSALQYKSIQREQGWSPTDGGHRVERTHLSPQEASALPEVLYKTSRNDKASETELLSTLAFFLLTLAFWVLFILAITRTIPIPFLSNILFFAGMLGWAIIVYRLLHDKPQKKRQFFMQCKSGEIRLTPSYFEII